jgi:hypothetical protein
LKSFESPDLGCVDNDTMGWDCMFAAVRPAEELSATICLEAVDTTLLTNRLYIDAKVAVANVEQ